MRGRIPLRPITEVQSVSTHLDGPVRSLDPLRKPTAPAPTIGAVVGWSVGWGTLGGLLSVVMARQVGAAAVLAALTTGFHLVVTLPLAMALGLFAVAAVAAGVVAGIGLAARLVRPARRTGARQLCGELLSQGAIMLPGYFAAWRRMRAAWVRGAALGGFVTLLLVVALVRAGLLDGQISGGG